MDEVKQTLEAMYEAGRQSALTVSPDDLRNAARTLDPTAWRARDTKRDSVAYGRRRKASLRSVRAVVVALGLQVG